MRTAIRLLMDWLESDCECVYDESLYELKSLKKKNMHNNHLKWICSMRNTALIARTWMQTMDENYSFRCLTRHINISQPQEKTRLTRLISVFTVVIVIVVVIGIQPTKLIVFFSDEWRIHIFGWLAIVLRISGSHTLTSAQTLRQWHCPQHLAKKKKYKIIEITFELRFSDDLRHIWNENSSKLSYAIHTQFVQTFNATIHACAFYAIWIAESKLIFVIYNLIKRNHGHNYV